MNRLTKILSIIFHPTVFFLIMPYLVVYRQTQDIKYSLKWFIFSSAFVFLAGIFFLIGKKRGLFSDDDISKREERFKFYYFLFILGVIYFTASIFLKGLFFPLSIIVIGLIIGLIAFNLVNRKIKASVHIAVSCAYVISIGILYGIEAFLMTFWVVPLVFWARVKAKKHEFQEGLVGAILGIVITLITYFLGKFLIEIKG